jgi:hypothetical protein
MSWVLGYMALYPEIQDKVYQEIQEVCHDSPPCKPSYINFPGTVLWYLLQNKTQTHTSIP